MSTSHRESPRRTVAIAPGEDVRNDAAEDAAKNLLALVERVRLRVDPDDMPPPLFAPPPCAADVHRR